MGGRGLNSFCLPLPAQAWGNLLAERNRQRALALQERGTVGGSSLALTPPSPAQAWAAQAHPALLLHPDALWPCSRSFSWETGGEPVQAQKPGHGCQGSRPQRPISGSRHPSPSSQPDFLPGATKDSLGASSSPCPTLGVQSLLPSPPNQLGSPSKCRPRGRLGSGEGVASVPRKGSIYSTNRFSPGKKRCTHLQQEREGARRSEGQPGEERRWKIHSVSWEGGEPPAPAKAFLSPLALERPGLTPGSVFCSCRALWAFRAESRAQYVRKAHPEEGRGGETRWGVRPWCS